MKIDAYLVPYFTEKDSYYEDYAFVMIDVLRASTSIASCLFNGAKEIIPCESIDKAVSLYSTLSKESRVLGGERNGTKPNGFDAGNSPNDYTAELVKGKTVIMATTNGTQLFLKFKQSKHKYICGFVNITSTANQLKKVIEENPNLKGIIVICAGTNGRFSYEDTICGGAVIDMITKDYTDYSTTDSAKLALSLFEQNKNNLEAFVLNSQHSKYLQSIGFEEDIKTALCLDKFPVPVHITGNSIKKAD